MDSLDRRCHTNYRDAVLALSQNAKKEGTNWLEFSSQSNGLVPARCKAMDRMSWGGISDEAEDTQGL